MSFNWFLATRKKLPVSKMADVTKVCFSKTLLEVRQRLQLTKIDSSTNINSLSADVDATLKEVEDETMLHEETR